jgi:hypothetical protein
MTGFVGCISAISQPCCAYLPAPVQQPIPALPSLNTAPLVEDYIAISKIVDALLHQVQQLFDAFSTFAWRGRWWGFADAVSDFDTHPQHHFFSCRLQCISVPIASVFLLYLSLKSAV